MSSNRWVDMANSLVGPRARQTKQLVWTLVAGFILGGILTELTVLFLPDSAARTFLTTSVVASLEPATLGLIGASITLGGGLTFNVLTLFGLATVAYIVRSWL